MEDKRQVAQVSASRDQLLRQYATGDQQLNEQIFGNLMLKPVNFQDPELYKMFKVKRPTTKKEVYLHQLDKLQVLISLYDRNDFDQVKFYNLNIDQKLAFLENQSFIGGVARKEKVIEALTQVAKSRDLKLFQERTEILSAVKSLALNHDQLS